ncbi:bifunctional DNA-formamidopyrimidine glycosylase/DNA-(apurinic or apyrimidinic site) lyase [Rhodospirillales bacterium]|nr:bifunctional DNA-formamidopyrimidine glycosylase/DNA-(apurinic or apyrimidinic site) lyase [Rhodospirillales bacterium]
MPELPEVETVRQGLIPVLEGRTIARATAYRPDLRFPLPKNLSEAVSGSTVIGIERRAKYLLMRLSGDMILLSHLGMSGRYRVYTDPAPALEAHDHVEFVTDQGVTIRYNDPRRFGFIDLFSVADALTHKLLAGLGPEPLSNAFDGPELGKRLGDRRTSIKAALLDQRVVAGVGNIYACEALYRAGISPKRMAKTVKGGRADKLALSVRNVLNEAIAAGGSSLRDHRQTSGELGYFQHNFAVYGRAGEPCRGCDGANVVKQIVQTGRSTFYCSTCQR